ncbi:hypothetical protein FPZ43_18070 [Mucilaginibacter pallidiroseus]|uniref:Uncharacterized protein n=1 Tax=Mucilaginibacter pallidiroseus TaxID=2599295 RepID=A0A563TZU0_9SPHI|nr:hypothetical protein [Mucilaginibacter pallidiroseus]TWR24803.1 hypothetical protein FPZ43_18070 [Mucilaginibacter pallidiroseus]
MLVAIRQLIRQQSNQKGIIAESYIGAALFLIIPWMLFPIFAGMGPPPITISDWLATSTEQQVRYTILITGGVIAIMGFALLKSKLENYGERFYSTLGFIAISVAMPLFILNMVFWGYYLTEVFKYFVTLPQGKRPEWYLPIKSIFNVISIIEVWLLYCATALFAIALHKVNVLTYRAKQWYLVIAVIGMILILLPSSVPAPLSIASYLAAIPAIPFIMPYLIGLSLLRLKALSTHQMA